MGCHAPGRRARGGAALLRLPDARRGIAGLLLVLIPGLLPGSGSGAESGTAPAADPRAGGPAGAPLAEVRVELSGTVRQGRSDGDSLVAGAQVKGFVDGFLVATGVSDARGEYTLSIGWSEAADPTVAVWWISPDPAHVPEIALLRESARARELGLWSPCLPRLAAARAEGPPAAEVSPETGGVRYHGAGDAAPDSAGTPPVSAAGGGAIRHDVGFENEHEAFRRLADADCLRAARRR